MAPMHVNHAREVPEYEINPKELDFTNSVEITKVKTLLVNFQFHCTYMILPSYDIFLKCQGTFCSALWRGTEVAVKKLGEDVISDEEKV
jgi:hypothetical protein